MMEKNDTLREECEAFLAREYAEDDVERLVIDLMAFASLQQAKGMREALRMVDEQRAEDSRRWALFRCEVKAQATAREQGQG